ncbi:uncharacterized protein LOC135396814 isoform X2 [Ornithodoros turicata]|uniref:uncharacterized protein LOC135396814 isoform X2 n=1 Tax=Ornithodoros turicata TaxID=34597 RepID=UPI00313A4341
MRPPVDISSSLLDMYDTLVAQTRSKDGGAAPASQGSHTASKEHLSPPTPLSQLKRSYTHPKPTSLRDKLARRPLSTSSESSSTCSSSSSSSSLHPRNDLDVKKSYLASIESLDQDDDDQGSSTSSFPGGSSGALLHLHHNCPCHRGVAGTNMAHRHSADSLSENGACPGSGSRYADPNLSYVDRVIMEIVDTERTYVRDLDAIVEGYLKPLSQETGDKISPDDLSYLFGNIEDIYAFNSAFLEHLEKCGSDPVALARCFVTNSDGFSVYTEFCTSYPRTVSVLTKLVGQSETAEIFKDLQLSLHHSLPLGSYLLKPVQRILKYHLLLQNIVKNFDKESDGYPDIKNALSVMTGIACHINEMKRKHEHAVRVQEIQSLLYGWQGKDLTTYGELVAEGSFRMVGAKALRHLFLFEKVLLITKKREEGILNHKTHIMCSNLMLIESIQGEPLYFQVVPFDSPCNQYSFQARNIEQKREWCLQLKRVIIESFSAVIPSHAKQLVLELGQSKTDEDMSHEKSSVKKSLSAPEYLKRRKNERRKSEMNLHRAFRLRRGLKKAFSQDMCTCSCHTNITSPRLRRASADAAPQLSNSGSCNQCSSSCQQRSSACSNSTSYPAVSAPTTPLPGSPANAESAQSPQSPSPRRQREWDLIDTSDTENEDNCYSGVNLHRPSRYRPASAVPPALPSGTEDSSGEYVTFEFANRYATRDAAVSCVDEGRSQEASNDDSSRGKMNYDSLFNLWTRLGTVPQMMETSTCSTELPQTKKAGAPVRRTQSFSEMARSKVSSLIPKWPGGSQRPTNLELRRSSLGLSATDCSSPTVPSVWLDQQQEHLPSNTCSKCGSLPRSFQLGEPGTTKTQQLRARVENSRAQHLDQRPFTIASDKPSQVDFPDNLDRYLDSHTCQPCQFKGNGDKLDEGQLMTGCSNTPAASLENVSTIHPDHRIYRREGMRQTSSWRNVLSGFGSKITNLRSSLSPSHNDGLEQPPDRSPSRLSIRSERSTDSKILNSRLITSIGRAYAKVVQPKPKPTVLASPRLQRVQGSATVAARMARPRDSNYCLPKTILAILSGETDANLRPDSVLSESSNRTSSSSSEGDKAEQRRGLELLDAGDESDASDASADSYYERTFEAIENVLVEEMFRDSAIYSEAEDGDVSVAEVSYDYEKSPSDLPKVTTTSTLTSLCVRKVKGTIFEKLKVLEENAKFKADELSKPSVEGLKSIQERRRELEQWCKSHPEKEDRTECNNVPTATKQLKDTTEPCGMAVVDTEDESLPHMKKGWVKHVVDRFQTGVGDGGT